MLAVKRSASTSALIFFLFFSTQAQTPQVSTVNVTPDESKVRISAIGDVLDMRVAVSDEAGDMVFESGPVAGDKLDWAMRDAQGQRVPAGSYTMTVTYRTANGKLRRRVEQVFVTEEVAGDAKQESAAPTMAAPVDGAGTPGRIGVGTTAPQQSLHAVGLSSRLRLQSTNGPALTTTEYVTNGRVWQAVLAARRPQAGWPTSSLSTTRRPTSTGWQ